MKIPLIDLKYQYYNLKPEIDRSIAEVLESCSFIGGIKNLIFEQDFASFIGAKHCIGVGNGTDALFIILKSLGIGPGDTVATSANSFIATSEAISLTGAKPVFVDCILETQCIDPTALESEIIKNRSSIKAVLPVHLYGRSCQMDKISNLSLKYGLHLVEDCAQAHGAQFNGVRIGNFGIASAFSFYPGKNLGAFGDAGAIVSSNTKLVERMRKFANHGRIDKYNHEFEGINSRLDAIQAVVLTEKLKRLMEWNLNRIVIAKEYNRCLSHLSKFIVTPSLPSDLEHVFHLYVIHAEKRDQLAEFLISKGIQTGVHYPEILPLLCAYKHLNYRESDFPVASQLRKKIISLPIFPGMKSSEIKTICEAIAEFYNL